MHGERLLAIQDDLSKQDLSDTSTPKLFEMMIRFSESLELDAEYPKFLKDDKIKENKTAREAIVEHILPV